VRISETSPEKCVASIDSTINCQVGSPVVFSIQAKDSYGNLIKSGGDPFKVVVSGAEHVDAIIEDTKDGKYTVKFFPTKSIDYRVIITLFGQHISNSFIIVHCVGGIDSTHSTIEINTNQVLDTKASEFTIIAKDSNERLISGAATQIKVLIEGPSQITPIITDNGNGRYTVIWSPDLPGTYLIHVKINDKHIHNSPISVVCHEGAYATNSKLKYSEEIHCIVTLQAYNKKNKRKTTGGDNTKIEVEGPNGPLPLQVIDNNDGTYTLKYLASHGHYRISGYVDGNHVSGSPFEQQY